MKSKNPFLLVGRIVLVFLFNFFVIFTNCLCNDKGTDEGGSAVVLDIQEIWDRKDVEDIVINVEVDDIVIREAGDDYVVSDTLIDTHPITDTQQVQNCEKKLSIPNFILLHPLTNGKIYIGWRLNKESDRIFYNIYRKSQHDSAFIKVNSEPITDSTNYIDGELKNGESYIYKITANLIEDNCVYEVESREHQIKYQERDDNVISYAILPKVIKPNGNCIGETIGFIKFGDVDGDLKVDYILSTDLLDQDGNRCEDIHVQMHRSDGTLLWYLNTNKGNDSAYYFQWTLFDIDGDGLAEAFGTYRNEGRHYLSLREGLSGKVMKEVEVPFPEEAATRGPYHGIAYVDGVNPSIVVSWGTYHWEHGYVGIFDKDLNPIWEWEAPPYGNFGGAHSIRVGDVDLDGKDEIIHSGGVLKDGKFLWRNPWNHYDALEIGDILPSRPGIELFFCFEGPGPGGVRLVEAETGNTIWERYDYHHCHLGWSDDIKVEYAGSESFVWYKNEQGGWAEGFLYSSAGDVLERGEVNYGTPIDWDGVPPKETFWNANYAIDLVGDYREEIINVENRVDVIIITIYSNVSLNSRRELSKWDSDRQYVLKQVWTGK